MYVRPVRRKKINLWLLILIILFIIAIVFTIIHMSNSSKANSDSRYSERNDNTVNKELNGSTIGKVDSYDSFSDISVVPNGSGTVEMYNEIPNSNTNPESSTSPQVENEPVKIADHIYSFKNLGDFSISGQEQNQFVDLKKGNLLYRLRAEKVSFNDVLGKEGLKSYLETTYNIQVTSELKTGTVNDIQMIICTIADGSTVGYLIITPLNDQEVVCLKVYDANNQLALIKDLSEPINDINSIKTNIQ